MAAQKLVFLILNYLLHAVQGSPVDPIVTDVAVNASWTPPPITTSNPSPTPVTDLVSTQGPIISAMVEGPAISSVQNYTTLEIYAGPAGPQATQTESNCNTTAAYVAKKTVAYFVTEHGNAVIDGDIIFGTEAELLRAAVNPSIHKRAFSLISSSPQKWPGGVVYYKWDVGLPETHKNYFLAGAAEWTNRLPFLRFVNDPNNTSGKARTVKASSGNRSRVGCCDGDIELCPSCNPRSARHEIGHSEFRTLDPL